MTPNNIYVFKTGLSYKNSVYLLDKFLAEGQSVCFFLYRNRNYFDIINKINDTIHDQYGNFIRSKNLIVVEYEDDTIETKDLIIAQSKLMKFSSYTIVNPKNYYTNRFIGFVNERLIGIKEKEIVKIKPYQAIDGKLRLCGNCGVTDIIVSKDYLVSNIKEDFCCCKEHDKQVQRTSSIIPFSTTDEHIELIRNDSFVLAFLKETPESKRENSYCFVYKKNNRVMNLTNEIVGDLLSFDGENLNIIWNISEDVSLQCKYILDSSNCFMLDESISI